MELCQERDTEREREKKRTYLRSGMKREQRKREGGRLVVENLPPCFPVNGIYIQCVTVAKGRGVEWCLRKKLKGLLIFPDETWWTGERGGRSR